ADPGEADLEYGIIEQLLRGVDRRVLARHPLPAGDVVRSSPFAVGAQFLGIVGDQQGAGPVALVIDDVQWADRRSVEALSFTSRRLSVDAVAVILIVRGDRDQLDASTRRMLLSVAQRRRISLSGSVSMTWRPWLPRWEPRRWAQTLSGACTTAPAVTRCICGRCLATPRAWSGSARARPPPPRPRPRASGATPPPRPPPPPPPLRWRAAATAP